MNSLYRRDMATFAGLQKLRFFSQAVVGGKGATRRTDDRREVIDLSAAWGAASRAALRATGRQGDRALSPFPVPTTTAPWERWPFDAVVGEYHLVKPDVVVPGAHLPVAVVPDVLVVTVEVRPQVFGG